MNQSENDTIKCHDTLEYEYGVGVSAVDTDIMRLRGQLTNCVNHLDLLKRKTNRSVEAKIDACIDSANRALYEIFGA